MILYVNRQQCQAVKVYYPEVCTMYDQFAEVLCLGSFYAGDSHDHGGTSASVKQRSRMGAVDILKKHQNKTSTLTVGRLPDPRAMVEIRSGLEDENSEAEMVCTHCAMNPTF